MLHKLILFICHVCFLTFLFLYSLLSLVLRQESSGASCSGGWDRVTRLGLAVVLDAEGDDTNAIR